MPNYDGIQDNKTKHPLYKTWYGMHDRCRNRPKYKDIKVCQRWSGANGFWNFVEDMGLKPSKKHSIDRVDNNGDYEKNNCRWALALGQVINRNKNRNSKNKYKGVRFFPKIVSPRPWGAELYINKKRIWLGMFETEKEAAIAYNNGAKMYFGEYANLNVIGE
jgi:hypothetical protein